MGPTSMPGQLQSERPAAYLTQAWGWLSPPGDQGGQPGCPLPAPPLPSSGLPESPRKEPTSGSAASAAATQPVNLLVVWLWWPVALAVAGALGL